MDQHSGGLLGSTPAAPVPPPTSPPVAARDEKRGGIGVGIFDEVKRMTADGSMTQSDAFKTISERTGRRVGTVAANYYSVARKRAGLTPRATRGAGMSAGSSKATGDAAAIIARLESATNDLAALLRSQGAELAKLREQSEQFEKLREWMNKTA